MSSPSPEFLDSIAPVLGCYYAVAAVLNVAASLRSWRARHRWRPVVWLALGAGFAAGAAAAFLGHPPRTPEALKSAIDAALGPVTLSLGTFAALIGLFLGRRFFVLPPVAWTAWNAAVLFLGASMTDENFAAIVLKPDNVPIVAMVFLLGFFAWLGAAQAVNNDRRLAKGDPPAESALAKPVLVWPDLVYIELICMLLLCAGLVVWSLALPAPLEQPANPAVTPNPSKAPWYFLGFQEMLVFSDPAMAGVVLPALIILGLAAVPYLDPNRKGSGYYTIAERPVAYAVFMFGFLQLWILLILIGTFLRGPNWTFFGLYEPRDPHRVMALHNVKLSEYFWATLLNRGVPQTPAASGAIVRLGCVVWREVAGMAAVVLYFLVLPWALGRWKLKPIRGGMGRARYYLMTFLLLMMLALPLKMLLHWTLHLSYIVSMPEYSLNF